MGVDLEKLVNDGDMDAIRAYLIKNHKIVSKALGDFYTSSDNILLEGSWVGTDVRTDLLPNLTTIIFRYHGYPDKFNVVVLLAPVALSSQKPELEHVVKSISNWKRRNVRRRIKYGMPAQDPLNIKTIFTVFAGRRKAIQ